MALVKVTRPGFSATAVASDGRGTVTSATAEPVTVVASSDMRETPRARFALGSVLFVVLAAIVAYVLDQADQLRGPLKLAVDVNAFALIYVAAQGIERLLEPLSYYIHPVADDKEDAKQKMEAVSTADTAQAAMQSAKDSANKAATVNRKQSERSILFWCLASLIGVVLSAAFGLHFLGILLDDTSRSAIPIWFDVVLTGLVIGGGTKALHGLVERISKPKQEEPET